MITPDQLQNEIIGISHHVEDALEAMGTKEYDIVEGSLIDIKEAVSRLKKFLPPDEINEIERIAGDIEPTL
jgi:hypothetical protein